MEIAQERIERVQKGRGFDSRPQGTEKTLVSVACHPEDVVAVAQKYIMTYDFAHLMRGEPYFWALTEDEMALLVAYYEYGFRPRPLKDEKYSMVDWARYVIASDLLYKGLHFETGG